MSNRTFVIGVGMTRFEKPGAKAGDYPDWVAEAGGRALEDAGVPYERIEQAFAGYVYGDSTSGQRALYRLGTTGIPIVNVNNNCSTGSSALFLARQAIRHGVADCALAVGFERMQRGSIGTTFADRTDPMDRHLAAVRRRHGDTGTPMALQLFGAAGRDHMARYGSRPEHFAWIAEKNHRHSVDNPYAQFQVEYSLQQILEAPMVHAPLTKLQCSPTSDGAAAAVLASERFVDQHGLWERSVEITGQALVTDLPSSFAESSDAIAVVGCDMSLEAARRAYEEAEVAPGDIDVCELHDCFSTNELISYEALGFARVGEGHLLVETKATTHGGDGPVVNPSGGLISKGHPLGATGLAQCAELTWQLRGEADRRQVREPRTALQHNIGLGGAAVVTIYQVTR